MRSARSRTAASRALGTAAPRRGYGRGWPRSCGTHRSARSALRCRTETVGGCDACARPEAGCRARLPTARTPPRRTVRCAPAVRGWHLDQARCPAQPRVRPRCHRVRRFPAASPARRRPASAAPRKRSRATSYEGRSRGSRRRSSWRTGPGREEGHNRWIGRSTTPKDAERAAHADAVTVTCMLRSSFLVQTRGCAVCAGWQGCRGRGRRPPGADGSTGIVSTASRSWCRLSRLGRYGPLQLRKGTKQVAGSIGIVAGLPILTCQAMNSTAGRGLPSQTTRIIRPCATDWTTWGHSATRHVPPACRTDG